MIKLEFPPSLVQEKCFIEGCKRPASIIVTENGVTIWYCSECGKKCHEEPNGEWAIPF